MRCREPGCLENRAIAAQRHQQVGLRQAERLARVIDYAHLHQINMPRQERLYLRRQ
jgi:hypothetical protein